MNYSMSQILLIVPLGYLIGSFPSGYLAGKLINGIDLREIGSGSTGATNVLRHVGKKAALIVFIIDVLKGLTPVLLVKSFQLDDTLQVLAGGSSLVGHIWPIWLKWKGGKAVATGLGFFLGLSWMVGLSCLIIFILVISVTKIVSLSSLIAAISLPILMLLSFKSGQFSNAYFIVSILSMCIVIWRHRSNVKRLINREEPQIGKSN